MKRGLILVFVLLLSISLINAAVIHPSSNILIKIDGTDRTLQYAADNTLLKGTNTYVSSLPINPGHDASQIWVSVEDGEMTILQALSSVNKLCPKSSFPTSYASSPANKSRPYHFATEVNMSSGKNLQEAINDYDICYTTYTWVTGTWSACPGTCGGSRSRTVYCRRSSDGSTVANSFCTGTKPATTTPCSCKFVDHGQRSCDVFIFWDTCTPYLSCSTAGSNWHCLYNYPGGNCGFLSMYRNVLNCENI